MEVSEEVKPLSLLSNFYCHTWFILPYWDPRLHPLPGTTAQSRQVCQEINAQRHSYAHLPFLLQDAKKQLMP